VAVEHARDNEIVFPALLRHARYTYGAAIRAALAEAGCEDMPPNGIYVVGSIARNGSPLAEVIRELRVSKQAALEQYLDPVDRTLCFWESTPMSQGDLEGFRDKLAAPKIAAMISAKSQTDVRLIRKVFGF